MWIQQKIENLERTRIITGRLSNILNIAAYNAKESQKMITADKKQTTDDSLTSYCDNK